ncbi:hypothetical protein WMY93_011995 [Mugilogobius chulae]|uniref:C-type lectin domain-containing protein n=1 Tax=Mugilogobius chulae TaxID=88201 RepID=A0AAW0P7W9_9GOBI
MAAPLVLLCSRAMLVLFLAWAVLSKPFMHHYVYPLDTELLTRKNMSWPKARAWCEQHSLPMFTLELVSASTLSSLTEGLDLVWMGLQRDPHNDSAWIWVNNTIIEQTEGDISQSLNWNEEDCAFYNSDNTWSSRGCDERQPFFCANGYYENKLSWHDAQKYCLNTREDQLYTILTVNDAQELVALAQTRAGGWIGLHRAGGGSWAWPGGQSLNYTAWSSGEPVSRDCGAFSVLEQSWRRFPCDTSLQVLCHRDKLEVVTLRKTWEEALEHCNGLGLELLVLQNNSEDYDYVRKRIYQAETEQVWIGLRFLAGHWFWVDNQPVEELLPDCPLPSQACGVVSKTDSSSGQMEDCSRKFNFVCYG